MLFPFFMCLFMAVEVQILTLFFIMLFYFFQISSVSNYYYLMSFNTAMDLLSWSLILLTFFISILMIMTWGANSLMKKNNLLFLVFFMMMVLICIFSTSSILMFYILFEFSLIPILFMVFGWGGQPERVKASMFLMMYTIIASLPLLLVLLNYSLSSTNLYSTMNLMLNSSSSYFSFFIFLITIMGFLVKFPVFPLHLWLPKAHVEAPVVGSMVLAAVLLKLGGYGLIRMLPLISFNFYSNYFIMALVMFGGSLMAVLSVRQKDMKIMIAYSSVSHMAMVVVCCLMKSEIALMGGLAMMLSHGVASSGLFSLVNMPYERAHSRNSSVQKGMLSLAPIMSLFWFILIMANMGAPPTINLMSEIMMIISIFSIYSKFFIFLLVLTFFAVVYSLVLYTFPAQPQAKSFPSMFWPLQKLETMVLFNHANMLVWVLLIFSIIF